MKKFISATGALVIAGASILPSVSADDENTSMTNGVKEQRQENKDERMQMNQEIKNDRMKMNQEIRKNRIEMEKKNSENRAMMGSGVEMTGMSRPPMPTGELKNFLKNPLTSEEQTALKTLLQTQQADREAIMKDTTLTPEARTAKLKELMATHLTTLLAYVSADKQDAFKKIMEEKMALMGKNQELHQENKDNRQEFRDGAKEKRQEFKNQMQAKKQALSEKLRGQLVSAVEKLNAEKLNRVLANIEKAVTKIEASTLSQEKKDRFLAQLEEIKTVVQDKIDALNGTSPDGNILTDVLSGVTTDSSSSSTTSTGSTTTTSSTGSTDTGTTTVTQ